MPVSSFTRLQLEKAATDGGFDLTLPSPADPWLAYASSHARIKIWLTGDETGPRYMALSDPQVAWHLGDTSPQSAPWPLPPGAVGARSYASSDELSAGVSRVFHLSRALPDTPLLTFAKATEHLPRTTEAERLVVQRVGQDIFRDALLQFWNSRCPLTGLDVPELLRASHIKPWADCHEDAERLDTYNGLLLAPHLDAAFDRGFITFTDDGTLRCAPSLSAHARTALGLDAPLPALDLNAQHHIFLAWHRTHVFRA